MTGGDTTVETAIATALDSRDAIAFVHAGVDTVSDPDPVIRYCRLASGAGVSAGTRAPEVGAGTAVAVSFDGTEWLTVTEMESAAHPVTALASQLTDRHGTGAVLTPARIPHDAALYLEQAGCSLASTTVVDRARESKTDTERERITTAQEAAVAGLRRGASMLAAATTADGRLLTAGDRTPVTPARVGRTIDEGIVGAGGFPMGTTAVRSSGSDDVLRPGEPIVVTTAPRDPVGYHGGLARTFVVDSEGGPERRAHVGVTQAFRSVQSMLTADNESVTAVEADLEAEIRGFGFGEQPIETRVVGVGLEPVERPCDGGDEIGPESVVRIDAAVEFAPDRWIRLADLLLKHTDGIEWLTAPSRSIDPATLEE